MPDLTPDGRSKTGERILTFGCDVLDMSHGYGPLSTVRRYGRRLSLIMPVEIGAGSETLCQQEHACRELRLMHSEQRDRIPQSVIYHRACSSVCGMVGEDVGSRREDRLVELDIVIVG